MKCSKCGAEIRTGCIYCENCGAEAQIVSEINILEEDLLRSMMEEEKAHEDRLRQEAEEEKRELIREKKRKKKMKKIILGVVIAAAAAAVVIGIFMFRQMHSFDYLLRKAQEAYAGREYQDALDYVGRARSLDGQDASAMLLQGEIYAVMKEDQKAEELFLQILEKNPADADAYGQLLKLYRSRDDDQKITELYEQAKSQDAGKDILDLFADFMVLPPQFDVEGGKYEEALRIAVETPQRGMTIYYTLDGSVPTDKDERYKGPIEIAKSGKTTLTAVCRDAEGNYSEPASADYEISLPAPDMPKVTPDGGVFTEEESITVEVPDGCTVYYTWGGGRPTTESNRYKGPIKIEEGNNILSLIAVDENGEESEVLKCNYIYYPE